MDDTKKALLSIDLDVAALTQNAATAKAAVKDLSDQLNALKASGKDTGDSFTQISGQLKNISDEAAKTKSALGDYNKGLADTAKSAANLKNSSADLSAQQQKNNQDTTASSAALDILKQRYATSTTQISELKKQFQALNNESITLKETHGKNSVEVEAMQTALKSLGTQINTVKTDSLAYQQNIAQLSAKQNEGGIETTKYSKTLKEYADELTKAAENASPLLRSIGETKEQFKAFREITGQVGDAFTAYREKVQATFDNSASLNTNASAGAKAFQTLKIGTEVAAGGVKAFSTALAETGINLVIAAINILINYFKTFQPVVEFVERAMAGFNGAMDAGKHVLDSFFGSITSVGDLIGKLGNILAHPIDALKNLGNTMADAATKTYALKKAQQELDDQVSASVVKNAEAEAKIAELKVQLQTAGLAQRKSLQAQIKALQNGETANHKKNVEQQVTISVNKVAAVAGLTQKEIGDIHQLDEAKIESLAKSKHLNNEQVKSLRDAVQEMQKLRKEEADEILKKYSEHETTLQKHVNTLGAIRTKAHANQKKEVEQHSAQLEVQNTDNNKIITKATESALVGNAAFEQTVAKKNLQDQKNQDAEALKTKKKTFDEERDIIEAKTQEYAQHFSKLATMFGKNTEAGKAAFAAQKALAAAEIAINTERQVSAIFTSTREAVVEDMKIPIIGSVKAAIDIAIGAAEVIGTIANGVKQVSTINSTNPQGFARGGLYKSDGYGAYLTGPGSGTSDSINARLSNGESIINARSTQMFAPILSSINQAGGGRAFTTANGGNGYALGGIFSGSNTLNDSSTDLANTRAMNDMMRTMAANMPRQVLVVEDVQASLNNKVMLQNMSNF